MVEQNNTIGQRAIRSAVWLYGEKFAITLINLIVMAILARQLDPADFGLVALANVLMRFNVAAGAATVGTFVIYDHGDEREQRTNAAFWLNAALTLATVLIFLTALPVIYRYYSDPLLAYVMLLVLVQFAVGQMRAVPDALVKRTLNFQKLVVRDTSLSVLSSFMSVGMALAGFGVWSLIVPGLFIAPLRVIIVMVMAKWVPQLPFGLSYWGEIFGYTKHIIGTSILGTLNTEGDTLLIGSFISATDLGIYNMAWNTATLTNRNIVSVVSSVTMPMLSAVQDQPERLKAAYLRVLRLLSILTFPALLGLLVVSDLFILTVYGPKWEASIWPLRILILDAIRRSITSPVTIVFNVTGRPDIGFKLSLYLLPVYWTAIVIGSLGGIVGIALGVVFARLLGGSANLFIATRLVKIQWADLLKELHRSLEASLLMVIVVYASRLSLNSTALPPGLELVLLILIGCLTYLIALMNSRYKSLLNEILFIVNSFSPKSSRIIRRILHLKMA